MSNLEALIKAYVELSLAWERAPGVDNKYRVVASCKFLEKMIIKEMGRCEHARLVK